MQTHTGMYIFEISSHCSPFWGSKPPNPQIWGINRRFQAKLAKSKHVHIIKTTASIPTKFCTAIKTTKCPSWVVPTHALQIQDSGRPPSWKNRKIAISRPRFNRYWRNLARWCNSNVLTVLTVKNLKFYKSKMAAAAILKNRKIAISRPWFYWFWRNLAWWRIRPSWLFGQLQRSKEIQDAGGRHPNNLKITIGCSTVWTT